MGSGEGLFYRSDQGLFGLTEVWDARQLGDQGVRVQARDYFIEDEACGFFFFFFNSKRKSKKLYNSIYILPDPHNAGLKTRES
jgi:hypothetical protein